MFGQHFQMPRPPWRRIEHRLRNGVAQLACGHRAGDVAAGRIKARCEWCWAALQRRSGYRPGPGNPPENPSKK